MYTVSTVESFLTTTVNVTGPLSWTSVGFAVFVTVIDDGTLVIVTVASSESLTSLSVVVLAGDRDQVVDEVPWRRRSPTSRTCR